MAITLMTLMAKLGLDTRDFDSGLHKAAVNALHGSAKIVGGLRDVAVGAAAATTAVIALAGAASTLAIKLAADAAPAEGIQAAFEGITGGGEDMLDMLRKQSAGMITNRNLMVSYNLAAQLVSKTFADQLPDAMGYLLKVSAATGQDLGYLLDSLVRGVGRLSPMILDNLGIQVDLAAAYEVYAKKIGKATDALTKEEQQTALTNQVMEKLAVSTAKMPDVVGTASQGLASLSTWFKNLKEQVGLAFLPALKELLSFLNMLAPLIESTILPALRDLGGWVADVTREWTRGFAELVIKAANWGANIVESLASGISGSGAIVNALRNVAATVATWLAPGSPPKLLPDLTKWGAGAVQAWLDGWSVDTLVKSDFARNLRTGLGPLLREIDIGKDIDPERLKKLFGVGAADVGTYLGAYRKMGTAMDAVRKAREELKAAEESGDADAIKLAKERLGVAEKDERVARRAFYAAEDQMAKRIAAEVRVAKAIENTAKVQQKAANDSARLAAEAEQRLIAQAYLQYRLAVAGTAAAQIPIWQEELAKAAEGSADYWNIMTRIVELQRQVGAGATGGTGIGVEAGIADEVATAADGAGETVEKIDWLGIGKAIGGALWEGIVAGLTTGLDKLADSITAWGKDPAVQDSAEGLGRSLAKLLLGALGIKLEDPTETATLGEALVNSFVSAISSIDVALGTVATKLMEGFIDEMVNAVWRWLGYETAPAGGMIGEMVRQINEATRVIKEGYPPSSFASGTNYASGGWSLVGEQGPELVNLPRGSAVHAASETERMLGTTNNINIEVNLKGDDVRRESRVGVLEALRAAGVA